MKAKLILKKHNDCYSLNDYREPSKGYPLVIAHSDDDNFRYKLSKQNCDEIFGGFDVKKLAEECAETAHTMDELYENGLFYGFISGFNKAIELNKDKLFTLEDMKRAFKVGFSNGFASDIISTHKLPEEKEKLFNEFIQFFKLPTEVDVEIVMERSKFIVDKSHRDDVRNGFNYRPKLDSEGCLILKKI